MLTDQERKILAQIKSMGPRDGLIYEVTLMLPLGIIIALSLYYSSPVGVIIGFLSYIGVKLLVTLRQDSNTLIMQSALQKMTDKIAENQLVSESSDG